MNLYRLGFVPDNNKSKTISSPSIIPYKQDLAPCISYQRDCFGFYEGLMLIFKAHRINTCLISNETQILYFKANV